MTKTKLKTIYGVEISVSEDGEFIATIDGKLRRSGSLKRLQTEIRKAFQGVSVIALYSGSGPPSNPEVEKIIKVDYHSLYGPGERRIWGNSYVYEAGAIDVLRSVYEEYQLAKADFDKRWEKRWRDVQSELTPVDFEQIRNQLAALESQASG